MRTFSTIISEIQDPSPGSKENPFKELDSLLLKRQQERSIWEVQWKLSVAFLEGFQWSSTDPKNPKTIQRKSGEEKRATWRVRIISDQIIGAVQRRLAKMTKNHPTFEAVPASGDPNDNKAARLAEALLYHYHTALNIDKHLAEALLYSYVSSGYWEVYWNNAAGKPIEYVTDPETGKPLPAGSDEAQELRSLYEDLEKQTVYEGEVGIETCSPFELYFEGGNDPEDAHSAIKVKAYDPEYIKERWGRSLEPKGKAETLQIGNGRMTENEKSELIIVKQLYVKPTNKNPDGYYCVWAQGEKLWSGKFPYAHAELPFVKFSGLQIPGAKYDASWIYRMIPLQRELNVTISQIAEYKNLTLWPQWLVPFGSYDGEMTSRPGAQIKYRVVPGAPTLKPEPLTPGNIPQYVFNFVDNILQRFNDVAGQHEVSQGQTPPNVEAGFAIQLLQEQDDTQIGPQIRAMENSLSRAGRLLLALAKQYYSEQRVIDVRGSAGLAESKSFYKADLEGAKDIRVVPGSMIPKSRAAEGDLLHKAYENGDINFFQYASQLDIGSKELVARYEAQRKKATRILELAKAGQEPAPPERFDDPIAQLEVLDEFFLTPDYETLRDTGDPAAESLRAYGEQLQQMADEAHQAELNDKIKIQAALQLKGHAGPSAVSEVLAGAGVQTDPEQLTNEQVADEQDDHERKQEQLALESTLRIQEKTVENLQQAELQDEAAESQLERDVTRETVTAAPADAGE